MTERIGLTDDQAIVVSANDGKIVVTVVDTWPTCTTRLDCAQARQLAAALIRALGQYPPSVGTGEILGTNQSSSVVTGRKEL